MKRYFKSLISSALGASLLISGITTAHASTPEITNDAIMVALRSASPEMFSDYKTLARSASGVTIPAVSSEKISITPSEGEILSISMPFPQKNVSAEPLGEGLVAFDNGNGSLTVPIPQENNSVAIHTVIENRAAPSRYAYTVDLPKGGSLVLQEHGGVLISDSSGGYAGGFTPPWAKDASGADLPTRFEVDGSDLVQIVDHSGADVTYPVIADPYMGKDLMMYPWITYPPVMGQYIVNINPTEHGRYYSGIAFHSAHVSELQNKLSSIGYGLASTIREQFLCHVYVNVFEPGTYNLESWRPNVYWPNQLNLWDRCNP